MMEVTDEKLYQLVDYKLSNPISLEDGNLTKSFLYDRKFGFFYVSGGNHQLAMALFFSWHKGFLNPHELYESEEYKEIKSTGIGRFEALADKYIDEIKGTCFKSSVSRYIIGGKIENFNKYEMEMFEDRIRFLDE